MPHSVHYEALSSLDGSYLGFGRLNQEEFACHLARIKYKYAHDSLAAWQPREASEHGYKGKGQLEFQFVRRQSHH